MNINAQKIIQQNIIESLRIICRINYSEDKYRKCKIRLLLMIIEIQRVCNVSYNNISLQQYIKIECH